jgi:hypothetical protein
LIVDRIDQSLEGTREENLRILPRQVSSGFLHPKRLPAGTTGKSQFIMLSKANAAAARISRGGGLGGAFFEGDGTACSSQVPSSVIIFLPWI